MHLKPFLPVLGVACALAAPCAAQGTAQAMRDMAARAAAAPSVHDYTVALNSTLHDSVLVYGERSGGTPAFRFSSTESRGLGGTLIALTEQLVESFARVAGDTPLVFKPSGMMPAAGGPGYVYLGEAEGNTVEIVVDSATGRVSRLLVESHEAGVPTDVSIDYSDWRVVEGVPVAFHRHVLAQGVRVAMFGDDDPAQLLARFRDMLPTAAPADQPRVREMIDLLQRVVEKDELEMDGTVASVSVNHGAPAGRLVPFGG